MNISPRLYKNRNFVCGALAVVLALAAGAGLQVGAIDFSLGEILYAMPQAVGRFFALSAAGYLGDSDSRTALILAEIRLPRLVLGMLCGAGLALAGAVAQGLFRNPMADPGLIGVSSGAAFGAAFIIVIGGGGFNFLGLWLQPLAAFVGAVVALLVVYRLSLTHGKTDIGVMLLAGIAVNAICAAAIGLLTYVATDSELRDLIFWSMGSLEVTQRVKLLVAAGLMLPAIFWLLRFANVLNANLLGEAEAGHLGFDMESVKRKIIILIAVVVGAAVSLTGVIGFVGLVVPHLVRLVCGANHKLVLPGSALLGAALLVVADIGARGLVAPAEIPIGIITALIGGPFFLMLLIRRRWGRLG